MGAPLGFWTGPGHVDGVYVDSDGSTSDSSATQTYDLLPSRVGTRRYVVALSWAATTDHALLSATIGGVAAAIRGQIKIGDSTRVAIFDAVVPDSGGDDIVVDFDGAVVNNPLIWLSVYDVGIAIHRDTDSDNADSNSISLSFDVLRGDFVVGCASAYRLVTAGAFTWTGLSEDSDVELRRHRCTAASSAVTADATLAVTATSAAANECTGIMAVYTSPG